MAIERKMMTVKPEKKKTEEVNTKKVKRGFKHDALADAIIDGKFAGAIGSEILVNRFRNGKESLHICTVKEIDNNGLLHAWDETLQQWFVFPVTQPPKVMKLYTSEKR